MKNLIGETTSTKSGHWSTCIKTVFTVLCSLISLPVARHRHPYPRQTLTCTSKCMIVHPPSQIETILLMATTILQVSIFQLRTTCTFDYSLFLTVMIFVCCCPVKFEVVPSVSYGFSFPRYRRLVLSKYTIGSQYNDWTGRRSCLRLHLVLLLSSKFTLCKICDRET